jgi:putative transposase
MGDHVHMLLSIPPKHSVAQVVGFIKGKAAIHIAGPSWDDGRTIRDIIAGLGDIMSQPWGGMRQ